MTTTRYCPWDEKEVDILRCAHCPYWQLGSLLAVPGKHMRCEYSSELEEVEE